MSLNTGIFDILSPIVDFHLKFRRCEEIKTIASETRTNVEEERFSVQPSPRLRETVLPLQDLGTLFQLAQATKKLLRCLINEKRKVTPRYT